MRTVLSLLLSTLVIAGCSSHQAVTNAPTPSPTTTSVSRAPVSTPAGGISSTGGAAVADYPSPAGVIAALALKGERCANPSDEPLSSSDLEYVEKATGCTIDGEKVDVAWFKSAAQRGQYLQIGLKGAGAYPHFVLGTTWAVATLTKATADKIAIAIGGRVY